MNSINLSKVDESLLKIVKEVSDKDEKLEAILIGGRALNFVTMENRFSLDSDFGLKDLNGVKVSYSRLSKFSKKVIKKIEDQFNIKIKRADNYSESGDMKSKSISHYIHRKFVFKILIFVNSELYVIEISVDETIDEMVEWNKEIGIKLATVEYMMAVKTIITFKRIKEGKIFENQNFRHFYDLKRLIMSGKIDDTKLVDWIYKIFKYEVQRDEDKNGFKLRLDQFGTMLTELISWLELEIDAKKLDSNNRIVNLKRNADLLSFENLNLYESEINEIEIEEIISYFNHINDLLRK